MDLDSILHDTHELLSQHFDDETDPLPAHQVYDQIDLLRRALHDWELGVRRADQSRHMYSRLRETLSSGDPRVWFVTINPDEKFWDLESFVDAVHTFVRRNKNLVISAMYVFEQRGSEGGNPMGSGFHCHMLLKTTERYGSKVAQRFTQSAFKQCAVHCPPKPTTKLVPKIDYMLGNKEEAKRAKSEFDKIWRAQENLEPYYLFPTPTCVGNPAEHSPGYLENFFLN